MYFVFDHIQREKKNIQENGIYTRRVLYLTARCSLAYQPIQFLFMTDF